MTRPKVRIGTLILLVVIAALVVALVDERRRFAAFRAEAQAERARAFEQQRNARILAEMLRLDMIRQVPAGAKVTNPDAAPNERQSR